MKLSVVIPAYNEVVFLPQILSKVIHSLPDVEKEIVIVDDCSTDGTREWLQEQIGGEPRRVTSTDRGLAIDAADTRSNDVAHPSATVRALFAERNGGKGAALRLGLRATTGDVIVIQDADLEYDPQDLHRFWPLFVNGHADVVYGSRFYGDPHRCLYYHHYFANKLISLIFSILYNQILTDLEVCYKMFTRQVYDVLTLRSNDFGFEIEFSSNVARNKGIRIYEVGISYYGRSYDEGKKINWRDGVKALFYLFWYRFV